MDRFKTWLVAAAIGLVVAGGVFLAWPTDDVTNSGDPLAGVPPADSTVTEVLESFETAPVYVDPDLGHLLAEVLQTHSPVIVRVCAVPVYR